MNMINVYAGRVTRGRGKTKNLGLERIPKGLRITIRLRTIGEAKNYLGFMNLVGTIVKSVVPLRYFGWSRVPP